MPKLTGRLGTWDLPHVHTWKQRGAEIACRRAPLISSDTRIATIGSCFAEEIVKALTRARLHAEMHPAGRVYNPTAIRQEIERIFGGWPECDREPYWEVEGGFVHPFKDPARVFPSQEALKQYSDAVDRDAEALFSPADVVIVTLGLIETWRQPKTGNTYRRLPHPDVFETLGAEFHRLTVAEIVDDLTRIRAALRAHTHAELIVTVSPVPLAATMTPLDVRVANIESKSRLRAAVSEFLDAFDDVHYFHSYEIVTAAGRMDEFMKDDGRHVHPRAVDCIIQQFLRTFACDDLAAAAMDVGGPATPGQAASQGGRVLSFPARLASGLFHRFKPDWTRRRAG